MVGSLIHKNFSTKGKVFIYKGRKNAKEEKERKRKEEKQEEKRKERKKEGKRGQERAISLVTK